MRVMPANNSKGIVHFWAGRYYHIGAIGHLYSPPGYQQPVPWLPYALDNGAFPCWQSGKQWDVDAFLVMCEKAARSGQPPLWCLVPDVVADCDATLDRWHEWAPRIRREFGFPLAFAAQDGMTVKEVPGDAEVVFIGGGTEWKRQNIAAFCATFGRVHVGRINTERWLWYCYDSGAESCDGTGWFRGNKQQLRGLENYLACLSGERSRVVQTTFREYSRPAGAER